MKLVFLVGAAVLVASCMSNPRIEDLSSADRARAGAMQVFKGAPDRAYEIIAPVTGLS